MSIDREAKMCIQNKDCLALFSFKLLYSIPYWVVAPDSNQKGCQILPFQKEITFVILLFTILRPKSQEQQKYNNN